MPAPAGWTAYLPVTMPSGIVPANMPDAGNTFGPCPFIFNENHPDWTAGKGAFLNSLAADASDLRVFDPSDTYELPWGLQRLTQGDHPELIVGLGIPSTYPLLSASTTPLRLYRGCTGGTFEDKAGVVPVADGNIGYYGMSDGTGGQLTDWTSNALHGTIANASWVASSLGGWALNFDASNEVVRMGNPAAFRVQAWTYSVMVRCTNLTSVKFLFGTYDQNDASPYQGSNILVGYQTTYDILRGFFNTTPPQLYNQVPGTGYPLTVNQWALATFTRDAAGNVKLYLNGTEVASGSYPGTVVYDNAYTSIGRIYTATGLGMIGDIGSVLVSGAVLSNNAVSARANCLLNNAAAWTVGDEVAVGGGGPHIIVPAWGRRGPSLAGMR